MFKKILFPTDFSDCAGKALGYIMHLRKAGAKEVIILHVIDDYGLEDLVKHCKVAGFEPEDFKKNVIGEIVSEKQKEADTVKSRLEDAGLKATVQIEFGRPHKEIYRIAEKENVSLIVIGAQGRGRISAMLLGSVSEGTLRNSRVPVFVVR